MKTRLEIPIPTASVARRGSRLAGEDPSVIRTSSFGLETLDVHEQKAVITKLA